MESRSCILEVCESCIVLVRLSEMQIAGGLDKTRGGIESRDGRKHSLLRWKIILRSCGVEIELIKTARATRALEIILTEGGVRPVGW
jgi:hypothetical protein